MTEYLVLSSYQCDACAVRGRHPDMKPPCWSCGQPARVTARVSIRLDTAEPVPYEGLDMARWSPERC